MITDDKYLNIELSPMQSQSKLDVEKLRNAKHYQNSDYSLSKNYNRTEQKCADGT